MLTLIALYNELKAEVLAKFELLEKEFDNLTGDVKATALPVLTELQQAQSAMAEYNAGISSGGEPAYPQWAAVVIAAANPIPETPSTPLNDISQS